MKTKLNVPDMHCNKCVERITEALSSENLSFQISLENRTVEIEGADKEVSTAISALDDLGFDAVRG